MPGVKVKKTIFSSAAFTGRALDIDLSSVRLSGGTLQLFWKSLLLLYFLLDSFETRHTYFLGQSPNFVLLRILKF